MNKDMRVYIARSHEARRKAGGLRGRLAFVSVWVFILAFCALFWLGFAWLAWLLYTHVR
jgi:hypothetical protein